MLDRRTVMAAAGASALAAAVSGPRSAAAQTGDLTAAARDAWLFVLPLIEMAGVRERTVASRDQTLRARVNTFIHARKLLGSRDRNITAPNNDTIYSNAFIDLTRGPVTLTVPDAGARYMSVAVMDMYTNNNVVLSSGNPGGAAGAYRLLGPGQTPTGPRDLMVATPHAWVLARVLVDGEADLPGVARVQRGLTLTGPDSPAPSTYARRSSDWSTYFASAAELVARNPPTSKAGYEAFLRIKSASRSGDFARSGYSPADAAAIDQGVKAAQRLPIMGRSMATFTDGWSYPKADLGQYGDDFTYRAIVAAVGIGALPPTEAMYLRAHGDDGAVFTKDGLYRMTLRERIPAEAFWSLTMYEAMPDGQVFLTDNPLGRFSIGDRTPGLKRSADGTLDIWISRTDPGGDRSSNWLPAPRQGPFSCTLRAYRPSKALRDGVFRLPPIVRA